MMPCPHYKRGTRNWGAVVLACPGRVEEEANAPASGRTGANLDCLLRILREEYHFDCSSRDELTITNAWSNVEYIDRTQPHRRRTQPRLSEVRCADNLDRLAEELCGIEHLIICCGKLAREAVRLLQRTGRLGCTVRVAKLPHLGDQPLNRKYTNESLHHHALSLNFLCEGVGVSQSQLSCYRRLLRLRIVAHCLYEQISDVQAVFTNHSHEQDRT